MRIGLDPIFLLSLSSQRSEEHTSELQSQSNLVCRLLLEKKNIHAHSNRYTPQCLYLALELALGPSFADLMISTDSIVSAYSLLSTISPHYPTRSTSVRSN